MISSQRRRLLLISLMALLVAIQFLHGSNDIFKSFWKEFMSVSPSWSNQLREVNQQEEGNATFNSIFDSDGNKTILHLQRDKNETTSTNMTEPPPPLFTPPNMSLNELTRSSFNENCTFPYAFVNNRIVSYSPPRKIPRLVHISMNSRCVHHIQYLSIQRWVSILPQHSLYFHDDEAVERLIHHQEWPEFPNLRKIIQCVRFKGAMLIDVWRVLILYRYGGIYSDIDVVPTRHWNEEYPIQSEDEFVAFNDPWNRPSQWLFAMKPGHVVGYYTMMEILKRILEIPNIARPKVVFVTGPDALRHGYARALDWQNNIFDQGLFFTKFGNQSARKYGPSETFRIVRTYNDLVNFTLQNMSIKEMIASETGKMHWKSEVLQPLSEKKKKGIVGRRYSCKGHLKRIRQSVDAE
jgi:mannosyltransferase OCH1-like enzyme